MVQSAQHGAVVLGPRGAHHVDERGVRGEDPLARFSPTAAQHLRRTDRFPHVADIMIGRLYDPVLDDGCAFEALISFHGGFGGPQTRAFILAAPGLPLPEAPIVGAEAVHDCCSAGGRCSKPATTIAIARSPTTPSDSRSNAHEQRIHV